MTKNELNQRYNVFIKEYVIDNNATRAYKVAFPSVTNETAAVNGSKLLRNTKVSEGINLERTKIYNRADIKQDDIVKEHVNIAFADITEIVKITSGKIVIKDFDELTPEQKSCISGVKQTKYGIEVVFYDKQKSLDSLARIFGMNKDKIEHSGEIKNDNPFSNLTTEELRDLIKNNK